jgi:hypothetical protein
MFSTVNLCACFWHVCLLNNLQFSACFSLPNKQTLLNFPKMSRRCFPISSCWSYPASPPSWINLSFRRKHKVIANIIKILDWKFPQGKKFSKKMQVEGFMKINDNFKWINAVLLLVIPVMRIFDTANCLNAAVDFMQTLCNAWSNNVLHYTNDFIIDNESTGRDINFRKLLHGRTCELY